MSDVSDDIVYPGGSRTSFALRGHLIDFRRKIDAFFDIPHQHYFVEPLFS